jgi:hypothetical protein
LAKKKYTKLSLGEQLIREVDVMMKHAASQGKPLSSTLVRDFQYICNRTGELPNLKVSQGSFKSDGDIKINAADMQRLHEIQNQLVAVVAPATPETLMLMEIDKENTWGLFRMFGAVPLERRMLFMAFFCFAGLLSFAFIDGASAMITNPLLNNQRENLILAVFFRLAAAGIGASFYLLYKAKEYIGNNTYDSKYESTYWRDFILGLFSGLILVTFFDGNLDKAEQIVSVKSSPAMAVILIAMLGGFSTSVVYEFMTRLVNAITSIFKPDVGKVLAIEKQKLQNNINEKVNQTKQSVVNHLFDLQSDIFNGNFSKEDLGGRVKELITDITDNGGKITKETPRTVNIPKNIPTSADAKAFVDNMSEEEYMKYDAIHEDDINEATEEEYVNIFNTRA